MRSLFEPATPGVVAATRVVLLAGAYHGPEDLLQAGFLQSVRARGRPVDLQFVDLELRHLTDRDSLERLHVDVVQAARAAGCHSIWLAGTSLGAYIALDYASTHPGGLRGLCLLAPFLGDRRLITAIERAPGLAAWQPDPAAYDPMDVRIWQYIQTQPARTRDAGAPLVYLGCGAEDRFARAHALLAAALPASAVNFIPGGHDLATWRVLWEMFLDGRWL